MRSWNHNTYYHQLLIRRLPPAPGRVLDVGCGDGQFAELLAHQVGAVVAIDVDPREVDRARKRLARVDNVNVRCADLLSYDADGTGFDAITALAVLHHMPFDEAVERMRLLLRPGGRLLILGVWPPTATLVDTAVSSIAVASNSLLQLARGRSTMESPTREPTMPLHEVRERVREILPGVRVQRRLLWRYLLQWTKPLG